MKPSPVPPAAIAQSTPQALALSGDWTARGMGAIRRRIDALGARGAAPRDSPHDSVLSVDAEKIEALDTAGAWVLQSLLRRLRDEGIDAQLQGLRPEFAKLMEAVSEHGGPPRDAAAHKDQPSLLVRVGQGSEALWKQAIALCAFIGESAFALGRQIARPTQLRWRPVLYNIRSSGFDALPIVGLLSFLLGIVVAYQGATQLKNYGANIFVVDLVGLSILREFAPLMTAIIVAGRSGSAYAAQIGTMVVTEEVDAMRTIGIAPIELLVLPKVLALVVALPLLTVFSDAAGVLGGMVMARSQLGVGFDDFLARLPNAIDISTFLTGMGKTPVFAVIIAVIGCFQGFRTEGGADSVGRQTTRSVVQSIFLVIVADALFSIAFSMLDL